LGSRAKGESIIDLAACELRVLEEDIMNRPPCCVVEGLEYRAGHLCLLVWYVFFGVGIKTVESMRVIRKEERERVL